MALGSLLLLFTTAATKATTTKEEVKDVVAAPTSLATGKDIEGLTTGH